MCLLITGSAANITSTLLNTKGLIDDIFSSNPDGLGVMYINKHGLAIRKVLPASADAARQFIQTLPTDDRQMALHWRWKTHGDINLDNCHPYDIQPGISAMMHNGVLKTGNAKDKSKSDTWHFVNDFLKNSAPDTLHDPAFLYFLGSYIGDNRFAIMSEDGRLSVVNKGQGVSHKDVWFSNTYAWSPELLIEGYRSKYRGYSAGSSWAKGYDLEEWADDDEVPFRSSAVAYSSRKSAPSDLHNSIDQALDECDVANLEYLLDEHLDETVSYILDTYHVAPWHRINIEDLTEGELKRLELWTDGKPSEIIEYIDDRFSGAKTMAEALCYHCIWTAYSVEVDATGFEIGEPADDQADPVGDGNDGYSMAELAEAMFPGLDGEDKVPH